MYKVFLIDDDFDDQEFFSIAVKKLNEMNECVFAKDGQFGLDMMHRDENFKPDFVFIDLNMPRMNGLECLEEIKKNGSLPGHTCLYLFYYRQSNDHGRFQKVGCHRLHCQTIRFAGACRNFEGDHQMM